MPRVLPDNNDVIVWRLNEGVAPFVNSSTSPSSLGSAANLVTVNGTVIMDALSVFGEKCLYFPSFGTFPTGASSTYNRVETATGVNVSSPISVSGWVKVRNHANLGDNFGFILMKRYRTDQTWNEPFTTLDFVLWNTANGRWRVEVTTSGSRRELFMEADNQGMPTGMWTHIGLTYNGTNLSAFLNGALVGTSVPGGGALDNGLGGPWAFGAAANGDGNKQEGAVMVCDWRVANVARSAGYFENIYRRGVLSW